jgi:hypothetical protein
VFISENDIVSFQLTNKENEIGSWMGKEPGDVTPHFQYYEERIES